MWPEKKTAFLIIHGIGQQNPFETLDAFVRGFYKVLEKNNNGKNIDIKHCIKPRTGDDKVEWVENFISLVKEGRTECSIDFYEYYWAHRMEGEITFQELVDWLIKTSDGAKKFYHENAQIVTEYEGKKDNAFKGGEFKDYWYLKHLGWFLRLLLALPHIVVKIIPKIPYLGSILEFIRPVIKVLFRKVTKTFVEYMGDVAIYTTTDVKSKHYNIRKLILYDSFKQVETLTKDKDIENIIIVGHSLGSVIAYDTINRLNYLINSNKEETDKEAITKCGETSSPLFPPIKEPWYNNDNNILFYPPSKDLIFSCNKTINMKENKCLFEKFSLLTGSKLSSQEGACWVQ